MKIAIGCDHVGIILKPTIAEHLEAKGITVIDKGAHGEQRTDYPLYAKAVADAVVSQEADLGILISANKVKGIRAVVCSEPYSAKLSRLHNNTNILAFGSRVIGAELAKMIVDEWLNAEFEGDRHQKRVEMIAVLETLP